MKRSPLLVALILIVGAGLVGCASDDSRTKTAARAPEKPPVSNLPWNRPQSWEGGGALGGMGLGGR